MRISSIAWPISTRICPGENNCLSGLMRKDSISCSAWQDAPRLRLRGLRRAMAGRSSHPGTLAVLLSALLASDGGVVQQAQVVNLRPSALDPGEETVRLG